MKMELNELSRFLRVESDGALVLEVAGFPVAELKGQLRSWMSSTDDTVAPAFIFSSDNQDWWGIFRIEPRPHRWQFTSSRERFRSSELLSLEEWRNVLRQSGV
jgi:hypothetical protein